MSAKLTKHERDILIYISEVEKETAADPPRMEQIAEKTSIPMLDVKIALPNLVENDYLVRTPKSGTGATYYLTDKGNKFLIREGIL